MTAEKKRCEVNSVFIQTAEKKSLNPHFSNWACTIASIEQGKTHTHFSLSVFLVSSKCPVGFFPDTFPFHRSLSQNIFWWENADTPDLSRKSMDRLISCSSDTHKMCNNLIWIWLTSWCHAPVPASSETNEVPITRKFTSIVRARSFSLTYKQHLKQPRKCTEQKPVCLMVWTK